MLEKNLNFADFMVSLYNNYKHPEEEVWKKQMNEFVGKLKVRSYCPLWEKKSSLIIILTSLQENERRVDEITAQLELLFTLECIKLYTNIYIDSEIYGGLFTEEIYDAFSISPLYEAIWNNAGKDINRFYNMVYQSLSWEHVFDLVKMFSGFDAKQVDSLISEIKETRQYLSEGQLDKIKEIASMDRGITGEITDQFNAAIIKSLEDVDQEKINQWAEKQDVFAGFDKVISKNTEEQIMSDIEEYFKNNEEDLSMRPSKKDIQDVYEYLKTKNASSMNEIDFEINEESKKSIQNGITSQMIKLISKKNALKKKYAKEEELLHLADTMMTMDSNFIDELKEILNQYQKKEK